jgi:hypothetical protein
LGAELREVFILSAAFGTEDCHDREKGESNKIGGQAQMRADNSSASETQIVSEPLACPPTACGC